MVTLRMMPPHRLLALFVLAAPLFAAEQISLQNALARARQYGNQIQQADIAAQLAREDVKQAKAAALPSVSGLNQFIYTEGNGTPSGVFVANDGVHIYNEQLQAHEELLAFVRRGAIHLASATAAVAKARVEVAARGLSATVIQDYYSIASAQRKQGNARQSLNEAQHFLDITRKQEQHGEAAHADVIKAQLQVEQRTRDVQNAELAIEQAKATLAVLIFPKLVLDYDIVDDLATAPPLGPMPEIAAQATRGSPDVAAAEANVSAAKFGVSVARYGYLPSFGLDVFYGINANQFAAQADYPTPGTNKTTLPNFLVPARQNLGYSAQATLLIPLWSWGSIRSKVKQANLRAEQAKADLTLAQKQLQMQITTMYEEAKTASAQVDSLRSSSDLSAESLRLTLLRYEAGEATALEVVDAQTTASLARSAYDDGLLRYRVALANVQNLTGAF